MSAAALGAETAGATGIAGQLTRCSLVPFAERTLSSSPPAEKGGDNSHGRRGLRRVLGGPTIRGSRRLPRAMSATRCRLANSAWKKYNRAPSAQLARRCARGTATSEAMAAPHSVTAGTATAYEQESPHTDAWFPLRRVPSPIEAQWPVI